jgi:hypothetical protein
VRESRSRESEGSSQQWPSLPHFDASVGPVTREPSAVLRNTLINSTLPNSLALRGLVEKNDFICVRIDA